MEEILLHNSDYLRMTTFWSYTFNQSRSTWCLPDVPFIAGIITRLHCEYQIKGKENFSYSTIPKILIFLLSLTVWDKQKMSQLRIFPSLLEMLSRGLILTLEGQKYQ